MNDPDWAPTLSLGHNKVKSLSNVDLDCSRRASECAAKRARVQEISSTSQIDSVRETIVESEHTCNLNIFYSGSDLEILEQIDERTDEFPEDIGSKGCQRMSN